MSTETTQSLSPETVKVGDGLTMRSGSDRYAGTVTWVSKSGKSIRFTLDGSKAKQGHGLYDASQQYEYTSREEWSRCIVHEGGCDLKQPDCYLNTNVHTARWNADSCRFFPKGSKSALATGRHAYRDPSF